MKKTERGGYYTSASFFKCLLMLKMIVLLVCFSVQSMANNGFGQEKITLNLDKVPLKKSVQGN